MRLDSIPSLNRSGREAPDADSNMLTSNCAIRREALRFRTVSFPKRESPVSGTTKNKNVSGDGGHCVGVAAQAFLLSGLLANAYAADPPPEVKASSRAAGAEHFQPARPFGRLHPELGRDELEKGKEGWAEVNMMIDRKGKAYEATVIDSSGNAAFEHAALEQALLASYKPAKLDGTPVDSSAAFKITFTRDRRPSNTMSPRFRSAYTNLTKAIAAADKVQADAELAKLGGENLYEDAYRGYGRYLYDSKWGTEPEQLDDLKRAVAGEREGVYLAREIFRAALVAQLTL
jgi:TonB family protein